jgi:hypothetical protein
MAGLNTVWDDVVGLSQASRATRKLELERAKPTGVRSGT